MVEQIQIRCHPERSRAFACEGAGESKDLYPGMALSVFKPRTEQQF